MCLWQKLKSTTRTWTEVYVQGRGWKLPSVFGVTRIVRWPEHEVDCYEFATLGLKLNVHSGEIVFGQFNGASCLKALIANFDGSFRKQRDRPPSLL